MKSCNIRLFSFWHTSRSIIPLRFINVCTNVKISSFCGWIVLQCVCVCVWKCVYISHPLSIHPSTDGHLGCFRILATENSVAVTRGVHVIFSDGFWNLWINTQSGAAGSCGIVTLKFWGVSTLPSTVAVPAHTPTNSVWGVPFLYILTNTCHSLFSFHNNHSGRCGSDLQFPNN